MRKIKNGDGWEIHEILDASRFKRINKYFYKRKRAPRIELKDKISQQYAGYTLIEKDLRNVRFWLEEVDKLHSEESRGGIKTSSDRETYNLVKGLYVAALTFYGKCFTSCEGRRIKLEKSMLDDSHHESHDGVMHMRHNFAAHSGADNFEEVKVVLVMPPNKKSNDKPKIYRELMQPDWKDNTESTFLDLVKHLHSKVLVKIDQIESKIYEKEIAPKGKEYWYKIANK